jgi:hypothetical protein
MVLNVASTHKGHFAIRTVGRTLEREIKHNTEGTEIQEKNGKEKGQR